VSRPFEMVKGHRRDGPARGEGNVQKGPWSGNKVEGGRAARTELLRHGKRQKILVEN